MISENILEDETAFAKYLGSTVHPNCTELMYCLYVYIVGIRLVSTQHHSHH